MRNRRLLEIAPVVAALFGASVVLACGMDFPWQLLDDRAATLDTMPINNSFAFAVAKLAPSTKDLFHANEPEYTGAGTQADALTQAEGAGLSSTEADTLQRMRAETSGDDAYNEGKLLPAAVRLYTAGAVDFHKGDTNKAIARFQEILDLPAKDRRDREVWAAYMLGRLYATKGQIAKASKSFESTRAFVAEGAPDPLGLAVASYGEQARLHLDRAHQLQKSKKKSATQRRKYGDEIRSAVALYAAQAAHGSGIGIDSLRLVANEVLGDDASIEASICDPTVQKLLVDRLLADAGEPGGLAPYIYSQLPQVLSAAQKCGDNHLANADQLAAIAYRSGDYHLAQRLVAHATGPLALWVRARLAMQKGNIAEAAKYYAEASRAFPVSADANSADAGMKALLTGQNSVLTLARGEYVDALEQLYPYSMNFWGDVAYIAERVLTVDELKTFVDTHKDTQLQPPISLSNLPLRFNVYDPDAYTQFYFGDHRSAADHLRDLLARRLVRAGRYQEALGYAPALEMKSSTPAAVPTVSASDSAAFANSQAQTNPKSRVAPKSRRHRHRHRRVFSEPPDDAIAQYVQALDDAKAARSEVDRARGLYRAAVLAGSFPSGNKILGTEGPPDFYASPGLRGGTGQLELPADNPLITKGERQRFNESAAQPDFRYHYIFVGADEAIRAANLLPPRSQAFAAVLCHATSWMIDGESCPASAADLRTSSNAYGSKTSSIANPLTVDVLWPHESTARINLTCQLYQRYLKAGAVVAWATDFGRDCPEPDFDSAAHFAQELEIREDRRRIQTIHHRRTVLFQLALIAVCLSASTWCFLRHRYVVRRF